MQSSREDDYRHFLIVKLWGKYRNKEMILIIIIYLFIYLFIHSFNPNQTFAFLLDKDAQT